MTGHELAPHVAGCDQTVGTTAAPRFRPEAIGVGRIVTTVTFPRLCGTGCGPVEPERVGLRSACGPVMIDTPGRPARRDGKAEPK